jgi:hypothetical protein
MKKLRLLAYFIALSGLLAACSLVENEEDCDPFGLDYEGSRKQPTLVFNLRYEREPNNWQPMIGYVYQLDSVWLYDENFNKIQILEEADADKTPFFVTGYNGGKARMSFPEKNTPVGRDIVSTYYVRLAYNDIDTLRFEYKLNKGCDPLFNYIKPFYNNEQLGDFKQQNLRTLSIVKK